MAMTGHLPSKAEGIMAKQSRWRGVLLVGLIDEAGAGKARRNTGKPVALGSPATSPRRVGNRQ